MKLQNFFKDKKGNTVIVQKPNFLVITAFLFYLISRLPLNNLSIIGPWGFRITILIWSLDEFFRGDSPFRRTLGLIVGITILFISISDILHP